MLGFGRVPSPLLVRTYGSPITAFVAPSRSLYCAGDPDADPFALGDAADPGHLGREVAGVEACVAPGDDGSAPPVAPTQSVAPSRTSVSLVWPM